MKEHWCQHICLIKLIHHTRVFFFFACVLIFSLTWLIILETERRLCSNPVTEPEGLYTIHVNLVRTFEFVNNLTQDDELIIMQIRNLHRDTDYLRVDLFQFNRSYLFETMLMLLDWYFLRVLSKIWGERKHS